MKILVFGITENPGGVESFIMNYYRRINREKYHMDFLCNTEIVAYEEEIKSLGGKVYRVPARSKNPRAYKSAMKAFYSEHAAEYNAIWVNVCSLANIDYLIYAKKYGIPTRIIHSHNSQNMDSRLRGILHKINRLRLAGYATDFWACTEEAANWFYRPSLKSEVKYVRNAIDIKEYAFKEETRRIIRKQYGLEDKKVLGNVGRLHFQKNQEFILEVFRICYQKDPAIRLILIGNGPDEEKLRAKASACGLQEAVIFAGIQNNIGDWLSAMDLFFFPSQFEGLGIALLEAQANGLPVIASADVIPNEVRVNPNFCFFSLSECSERWACEIIDMFSGSVRLSEQTVSQNFKISGYGIADETKKLENLLERSINE